MKTFSYMDDVATLRIDDQKCVGCGTCAEVCPHGVFILDGHKALIDDLNSCMECGACARNCPSQALSLTPGVGCAGYIIQTWIKGKQKAACGSPGCC